MVFSQSVTIDRVYKYIHTLHTIVLYMCKNGYSRILLYTIAIRQVCLLFRMFRNAGGKVRVTIVPPAPPSVIIHVYMSLK